MIFLKTFSGHISVELNTEVCGGIWRKPADWSGPEPALYKSFDTSDGLVLWEGIMQMSEFPLVPGKVMVNIIQISSM